MFFALTGLVLGIPLIGLPLAALVDLLTRDKEPGNAKVGWLLAILRTGLFGAVAYFYWQAHVRRASHQSGSASPSIGGAIIIGTFHFFLVAAVFVLAVFVVPGFVRLLADFGKPRPLITRHLVAFSAWV